MRLALIGYGKMGKAIEKIAESKGYAIVQIITSANDLSQLQSGSVDVAIEFTQPESAFENCRYCLKNGIPVISGTTGWNDQLQAINDLCEQASGTFMHASNYSIGVNLFFELNKWLAAKMATLNFRPSITEIHHTEKKDSPSGTAITLAEAILKEHTNLKEWINEKTTDHKKLAIVSERKLNVPGTHAVSYSSDLESIEIKHTAHDRSIFAEGVVTVAEWIHSKRGFFTMSDFINEQ